ncbi:transposase [Salinarimonas rosea]|uniref:transposase n=1 Tax=Salinarimonas rosea TaxID=552063 RepID=UPI00041FD84C|nr:transposase [Salinarimonas rosea]
MSEPRDTIMSSKVPPAAADAPVGGVGGRSPSKPSTGQAATPGERPQVGPLGPGQRWSLARKKAAVMRMLRGESVELLSRELGVPVHKLERWRDKAAGALDDALKERETETVDADLAAALRRVGELTMENELLRARMERTSGPLARRRSR